MSYGHADKIAQAGRVVRQETPRPPIDPALYRREDVRRVLAVRDVAALYRLVGQEGTSQRQIAELVGQSQSEVSEIMKGRRVTAYDLLERIALRLGIPRELMGLSYGEQPPSGGGTEGTEGVEVDDNMQRRDALAVGFMAALGAVPPFAKLLDSSAAPKEVPLPSRLGTADVAEVRQRTQELRLTAQTEGGQARAANAAAASYRRLTAVPAAEAVTRSLGSALAELEELAGWCCYDAGLDRHARWHYRTCEARSWPVTTIIEDNDRSASRGVREGYAELLAMIENRAVDRVVVLRLDRLLRRVTDLEALIELTERTGVKITTVEGDLDLSNPSGRLMGRIMASVARGEIETKSARQKLANAQAAAAGKPHGSRRPYGYEADLMTVYEPEARILRTMAGRVIAGHSCKEVAYWAHEHGYTTTMGKPFYPLTVRNILMKKRYAGIREYEGAEYPAAWQPVFDPETWQRLQLTLKLRRDRYADAGIMKPRKYLLTGLAYCGKCGRPMNGSAKRDRAGAPLRRTYLCRVQGALSETRATVRVTCSDAGGGPSF